MTRLLFLCITAILIMSMTASAAVMSYQGMLTDGSGATVPDGNYSIHFALFDASTAGAKLWEETHPTVPVTGGMFLVLLGSIIPIDNGWYVAIAPNGVFLEVAVNGDNPISPRTLMTSTPQSMSAYRLNGDLITAPGMLDLHPPDPGAVAQFYPGFRVQVDTGSSSWNLFTPGALFPEDSCGKMEGTVSTEIIALDLSGAADWGDPCDTLPEVRLSVDAAKASLLLRRHPEGSFVDISANMDASISLMEPNSETGIDLGITPAEGGKIFVGSLPSSRIYDPIWAEMVANSGGSSVDLSGGQPLNSPPHELHLITDTGSSDLWLGSVDPFGETLPVISMHANAKATFNLGFAGSNPPDDSQPPPDNSKPGVVMTADANEGTFELRGPDGGAQGGIKTITMIADGTDARVGIGIDTSSEALFVVGNIVATGNITAITGTKVKKNIVTVEDALDKVTRLRGVTYDLKRDEYPELRLSAERQLGFLAEEVQQVIPHVVLDNGKDLKSVDYSRLTALLVEAIKEQQNEIELLKSRLEALEK